MARFNRSCVFFAVALLVAAGLADAQPTRPQIGVALGGGSARAIAHVGVLRWFDEHRIPIDRVAGTSMGGFVGGAFAAGMSPAEIAALLENTEWPTLFGRSGFAYKNIRRKTDARDYPGRLEFGLRSGLVASSAVNDGHLVDLVLARLFAAYYDLETFDDLPTPFRTVATDLITSELVVLDRGSLSEALRATMAFPGTLPPVESERRVFVDGGALNNLPADIVQQMGSDVVIAVSAGSLTRADRIDYSALGLIQRTIDTMIRATTRDRLASATLTIEIPLDEYGTSDFDRTSRLIDAGYRAAEAHREVLLPYALDESAWARWKEARAARRRSEIPAPQSLVLRGMATADERRLRALLDDHLGQPLDTNALERDLAGFSGLDRYETITWRIEQQNGPPELLVAAQAKPYAPPFLMLGIELENTTGDNFLFTASARYLAFDVAGSGSELRVDGRVGSTRALAAELYRPLGRQWFAAAHGGIHAGNLQVTREPSVIVEHAQFRAFGGADIGFNTGPFSEARAGVSVGRGKTEIDVGDPALASADGREIRARIRFAFDGQNNPVVPSKGARLSAQLTRMLDAPASIAPLDDRTNEGLTQAEASASVFRSIGLRDRTFVTAAGGTSFGGRPLAPEQFSLGLPLRLGSATRGDRRGDHYALVTAGYLRELTRLPEILGGSIFAGSWLESGSAFDDFDRVHPRTHLGLGLIVDTIVGPAVIGTGPSSRGGWQSYFGIGPIFR